MCRPPAPSFPGPRQAALASLVSQESRVSKVRLFLSPEATGVEGGVGVGGRLSQIKIQAVNSSNNDSSCSSVPVAPAPRFSALAARSITCAGGQAKGERKVPRDSDSTPLSGGLGGVIVKPPRGFSRAASVENPCCHYRVLHTGYMFFTDQLAVSILGPWTIWKGCVCVCV